MAVAELEPVGAHVTTVPVAIACLAFGVLCYGLGGARLADGSRHSGGFLTSIAWWVGTSLQGAGFGLTLIAREQLPLLIVQASVVGALGVTAVVQHLAGALRLGARDALAICVLTGGIAALATATVPGPSIAPTRLHLMVLVGLTSALILSLLSPPYASTSGALSGAGFATSAIAARLFVGHRSWWDPREWPAAAWLLLVIVVLCLATGQLLLTRGLANGSTPGVLGSMYLIAVLLPGGVGMLFLGEQPTPGSARILVLGLVPALLATIHLLRMNPETGDGPSTRTMVRTRSFTLHVGQRKWLNRPVHRGRQYGRAPN